MDKHSLIKFFGYCGVLSMAVMYSYRFIDAYFSDYTYVVTINRVGEANLEMFMLILIWTTFLYTILHQLCRE